MSSLYYAGEPVTLVAIDCTELHHIFCKLTVHPPVSIQSILWACNNYRSFKLFFNLNCETASFYAADQFSYYIVWSETVL